MSINNEHKISEKELDNLLNQSFLNLDFNKPENEKLMETISNELLQVKPLAGGFTAKAFYAKLLIVAAIITSGLMIYRIVNSAYTKQATQAEKNMQKSVNALNNEAAKELPKKMAQANAIPVNNESEAKEEKSLISQTMLPEKNRVLATNSNLQPTYPSSELSYFPDEKAVKNEDSGYVFPKLTEKEIKATVKQKEKMINWLFKQSKERYSLITPKAAGPVTSDIADTNAAFYMQNYEVTNLEYRTFLFDLLMNDRKQDFLAAKPYQKLWLNTLGSKKYDAYANVYFSDKRFDDYPVVNISKEGAELYCQWLSSLSKKGYSAVAVRLPYTCEWTYAAKGGMKGSYPWGTDSIKNPNGCYMANFCVQKLQDKLVDVSGEKCTVKKYRNAYSSAGMALGDSVLSVPVSSYNPNEYGLYCMAGNVAEMTCNAKTKAIKPMGGSWNSSFENCRINNPDEPEGTFCQNQMTGFRPVFRIVTEGVLGMTKRDDPKTGLPLMTAGEIQTYQKQKKKLLEALINYSKNDYAYIPMGSCVYKSDTISVQSFYMQTTEVTNLQYRTFLFDLLQQNRTEDFLLAKPDQKAWNTRFPSAYNQPMELFYFAHPAYDDYPVVNISRKAAEMYCIWLSQEANALLKERGKPLMNDVRLPVDIEWAYAASNKQNAAKYATGHTYLRDSKGRYEMNYSGADMASCGYDSIRHLYMPYMHKPVQKDENDSKFITDGAFHTAYTRSYQPNSYGLYCMAGNVSEMVTVFNLKTRKPEKPGTKGGSWFSCDYFLEIDATEENPGDVKPSPMIGFRPVITALQKK